MVDYWSVVVDYSRSKVKGLNPLQIYNTKQALSSILIIIFLHIFFAKSRNVHIFTYSRVHGGGLRPLGPIRPIGPIIPLGLGPIGPLGHLSVTVLIVLRS